IAPRDRARDLVDAICAADSQALRPRDYPIEGLSAALQRAYHSDSVTAGDLAETDLRLTQLFLQYGGDLLAGRVDPSVVDGSWYIRTRRATIDSTLIAALARSSFDQMTKMLAPSQPDYETLAAALLRYRAIADSGGWPTIPRGPVLAKGSRGKRVTALRLRLAASGDLEDADTAGHHGYDEDVQAAVASFQERHGLEVDSAVGPATLAALNVPLAQRIRQIEINLERLRWLPNQFGDHYILVNIPAYQLTAYDHGKAALAMKVIVGDEYKATPVFADSMSYLVFRPRWNVPASITYHEIIPGMEHDKQYLARHRMEVVDARTDSVVDPGDIDWGDIDTTDFKYQIRQKPGPDNSLGLVKFMFPNQFNIYLHDTPAGYLFGRRARAYSHGCIRLEHPVALAQWVLAGQDGWDEQQIRHEMETDSAGVPSVVQLDRKVPVYLVYLTAYADHGKVQFRDDVYGLDQRAMTRMKPAQADSTTRRRCERLKELIRV
ncbi:MAG TPA: L,D-transpeptidase family protein, partial [Gemmatimonadales bacterium]|nr:L,D-transpeptidase family protein [Gemmatimonadales bacterium]